ncbi:hypothetical protein J6590_005400 [Homalodisca vitripennis]|nr:hypothetical protein J6590_005400 [Homalodisca vitripennis]
MRGEGSFERLRSSSLTIFGSLQTNIGFRSRLQQHQTSDAARKRKLEVAQFQILSATVAYFITKIDLAPTFLLILFYKSLAKAGGP